MANLFIVELRISAGAEDELAVHGLVSDDALEVSWNSPSFFRDKVDGRYRMIGTNDGGAVLTVIIEPVDGAGTWAVVTGWQSSKGEKTLWTKTRR